MKLVLIALLGACGGSEKKPAPAPAPVVVAPAPVPTTPAHTPSPKCIEFRDAVAKVQACAHMPQANRDAWAESGRGMLDGITDWSVLGPEITKQLDDNCKSTLENLLIQASSYECL